MSVLQFFIVAIVFTILGFIWGYKFFGKMMAEITILLLVKEGYLKAKCTDGIVSIVKYNE
jgi:hypothetical protein